MMRMNAAVHLNQVSAFWRVMLVAAVILSALVAIVNPALAAGPAPDTATAKFEVRFMEGMMEHHMMAVKMAEMCLEQAVHPELASMCEDIIVTQEAEMKQMHEWLMEWYGIEHEMPEMKMTGEMKHLMSLEGTDFEETFLKTMIRHHWGAIVEARQAVERSYHPELREMGEDIIAAQSQEIEQMRTWLREWYGYQNFGPQL